MENERLKAADAHAAEISCAGRLVWYQLEAWLTIEIISRSSAAADLSRISRYSAGPGNI